MDVESPHAEAMDNSLTDLLPIVSEESPDAARSKMDFRKMSKIGNKGMRRQSIVCGALNSKAERRNRPCSYLPERFLS